MTTLEVLEAARALVARGWCQGEYRDCYGKVCAFGAIIYSFPMGDPAWHDAAKAANDAMTAIVGGHVTAWNDAPGRTQEEVLAAFDQAVSQKRKS